MTIQCKKKQETEIEETRIAILNFSRASSKPEYDITQNALALKEYAYSSSLPPLAVATKTVCTPVCRPQDAAKQKEKT